MSRLRVQWPRRLLLVLLLAVAVWSAWPHAPRVSPSSVGRADAVLVHKAARQLHLLRDGTILATFPIALGGNPIGHKRQEGDQRTPEGHYTLDYKNADSGYHKAIRISYPNAADTAQAEARGVSPGGLIMIHGQPNSLSPLLGPIASDWTLGCIALSNTHMDVLWDAVAPGTPIELRP